MFRSGGRPFRVSAAVMTFLFLALLAIAASPALHQAIHPEAKDAHHDCAITALAHGQVDAPTPDISVAVPNDCVQSSSPVTIPFFSTTLKLLPPARAPPSPS
jgi:hypothetical protein